MKGTLWSNLDINLALTDEEFDSLIINPLECELVGESVRRKAKVRFEDLMSMGDGIKVEYDSKTEEYDIIINQKAYNRIKERGEFGTRYGMGNKITFYKGRFDKL